MTSAVLTRLDLIARQIESDILARGLQHGDRYLTVADASVMLGVSPATANRAMNLLVTRRVLTREHGSGTFVGEAVVRAAETRIRTVYVMLIEEHENVRSIRLDVIVDAIRERLGGVNVQFTFVPSVGGLTYVRTLIESAQQTSQLAGVVAISCSREVYRYLANARVPTIVLGSPYGDYDGLPSVDIDYRVAGRLLADHLVSRGHRRMALFSTSEGRPGDHALLDGVGDALAAAGLPSNSLRLRIFPGDFDTFRTQVRELLASTDRPTGVICNTERLLATVALAASDENLSLTGDLEIVFSAQTNAGVDERKFARTEPRMQFRTIAETVADMLKSRTEDRPTIPHRVIVEPALCVAEQA